MGNYYRTLEMNSGGPFPCFLCGGPLAPQRSFPYALELECRCGAGLLIECPDPIPAPGSAPTESSIPTRPTDEPGKTQLFRAIREIQLACYNCGQFLSTRLGSQEPQRFALVHDCRRCKALHRFSRG